MLISPNSLLLIEDDWGEGVHEECRGREDGQEERADRKGKKVLKKRRSQRGNGLKDKGSEEE